MNLAGEEEGSRTSKFSILEGLKNFDVALAKTSILAIFIILSLQVALGGSRAGALRRSKYAKTQQIETKITILVNFEKIDTVKYGVFSHKLCFRHKNMKEGMFFVFVSCGDVFRTVCLQTLCSITNPI